MSVYELSRTPTRGRRPLSPLDLEPKVRRVRALSTRPAIAGLFLGAGAVLLALSLRLLVLDPDGIERHGLVAAAVILFAASGRVAGQAHSPKSGEIQ